MVISPLCVRCQRHRAHDIMMGDAISSDASAMDVDSHESPTDDGSAQPATLEETAAAAQPGESLESTGFIQFVSISTENIAWS